jgi:hypothetical protein
MLFALLASVGVQAQDAQLRGRSSGPQPEPGNISGNAVDTYQEFQLVMGEGSDIGTVDHDADQTDVDVDEQEETTRTELPSNFELSVYPNPATDFLVVDFGVELDAQISLLTILGQQVWNQQGEMQQIRIPVFDMKPGVYFLNVTAGEERFVRRVKLMP